jgi:hypothetical protein
MLLRGILPPAHGVSTAQDRLLRETVLAILSTPGARALWRPALCWSRGTVAAQRGWLRAPRDG